MHDDTIAAVATPPGEGGIGIVRLSGPEARAIAQRLFQPRRVGPLRSYRLRYGHVVDPATGAVVDEAVAAYMAAPRSFTREDVVELSVHGGPLPVQATLGLCLAAGARLARPGEFTLRAFLNGRIDLTQAEATLDVIRAQTDAALALAQAQLGGWLAREVRAARQALLEALAYITVVVDFPEDEVEPQDIGPGLRAGLVAVEALLRGADQGIVYRQGARAALVGMPNVGKSSLLNALLRADRAIVTPIPGTTRDTLEETANLGGIPVVLVDTAGIRASDDPVERLGVERSRAALAGADLALLILDSTRPLAEGDRAIAALTAEKPTIVVWNKIDQGPEPPPLPLEGRSHIRVRRRTGGSYLPRSARSSRRFYSWPLLPGLRALRELRGKTNAADGFEHQRLLATVEVSARTGEGVEELARAVAEALLGGVAPAAGEARLVSSPRHRDALRRAREHLGAALAGWEQGHPTDLLGGDLTAALNALGEITGETVGEDLLDIIFSRFCIGK